MTVAEKRMIKEAIRMIQSGLTEVGINMLVNLIEDDYMPMPKPQPPKAA